MYIRLLQGEFHGRDFLLIPTYVKIGPKSKQTVHWYRKEDLYKWHPYSTRGQNIPFTTFIKLKFSVEYNGVSTVFLILVR